MTNDLALPAPGQSRRLLLQGPAGALDAELAMPAAPPRAVALVCHPHPLYGGEMSNKVTWALANSAVKAGAAALRFNFRGVGGSAGRHDEGRGETDDVVALAAWLAAQLPGLPLLLAGFSFGGYVSLNASARAAPRWLITVAPPLRYFGSTLPPRPAGDWLLIHSRDDEVVPFADAEAVLASFQPPPELHAFDGAGHFFHGRVAELQKVVAEFLARHPT